MHPHPEPLTNADSVEAKESRWPKARGDLFQRGGDEQTKGQRVSQTTGGKSRNSTIALIWRGERLPGQPSAFIRWDTPAEGSSSPIPELEIWDMTTTMEARVAFATIAQGVQAASAAEDPTFAQTPEPLTHVEISAEGTAVFTAVMADIFNGPWCGPGPNFDPPTITRWARDKAKIVRGEKCKPGAKAIDLEVAQSEVLIQLKSQSERSILGPENLKHPRPSFWRAVSFGWQPIQRRRTPQASVVSHDQPRLGHRWEPWLKVQLAAKHSKSWPTALTGRVTAAHKVLNP